MGGSARKKEELGVGARWSEDVVVVVGEHFSLAPCPAYGVGMPGANVNPFPLRAVCVSARTVALAEASFVAALCSAGALLLYARSSHHRPVCSAGIERRGGYRLALPFPFERQSRGDGNVSHAHHVGVLGAVAEALASSAFH